MLAPHLAAGPAGPHTCRAGTFRAPLWSRSHRKQRQKRLLVCSNSQLGLLYATCSGSTRKAAWLIQQHMRAHCSPPIDIDTVEDFRQLAEFSGYIVGAPTWNTAASQQRTGTAWDDLLYNGSIQQLQLQGKPVAVFGCGDALRFKHNFADALAEVHDVCALHGAVPLGYVDASTYLMHSSKSIRGGRFLGLPLDEHNQAELSSGRIQQWCQQLQQELLQAGCDSSSSSSSSSRHTSGCASDSSSSSSSNHWGTWRSGSGILLPTDSASAMTSSAGPVGSSSGSRWHSSRTRGYTSNDALLGAASSASSSPPAVQQQQQPSVQPQQPEATPLFISSAPAEWPHLKVFSGEYPRGFRFMDRWYQLGDRWYRFVDAGFIVTAGFREHKPYTYAYQDVVHIQQISTASVPQHPTQQQQQQLGHGTQHPVAAGSAGSLGSTAEAANPQHLQPAAAVATQQQQQEVEVWITLQVPPCASDNQAQSVTSAASTSSLSSSTPGSSSSSSSTVTGASALISTRQPGVSSKVLVLKQVECWQPSGLSTLMQFLQVMCPQATWQVHVNQPTAAVEQLAHSMAAQHAAS